MTLHQLKVFATVAKLRNFTQAAENLHVSQPSVTLVIQGLGRELEIKLFERLGNKVRLTTAGERLLHHAEEILTKVDGIKEEIDELKGLKKGTISIGGGPIPAASFLPTAIQKFKKKHPEIEVIVKVQGNDALEKELLEGDLDLAFFSLSPRSQLLHSEPYYEEEFVAIAPPRHPLTKKRQVPLELIAKEPLIAPGKGAPARELLEQKFTQQGILFKPTMEITTTYGVRDIIRNAVASGLGIGFIARCHVTGDIKAGRVKVLRVPGLNLKRTIYMVVHKSRQNAASLQAFQNLLKSDMEQR